MSDTQPINCDAALTLLQQAESPDQFRAAFGHLDVALAGSEDTARQHDIHDALTAAGFEKIRGGTTPSLVLALSRGEVWLGGELAVNVGRSKLLIRLLEFIGREGGDASREAIYSTVWDQLYLGDSSDNALHVAMNRLRRKICCEAFQIDPTPSGAFSFAGAPAVYLWASAEAASIKAPAPPPTVPHNLTPLLDSSVGRADMVEQVLGGVSRGARVLSIVGMGGAGKTRLARMIGLQGVRQSDAPKGGIWFVDLSEKTDIEGMTQALSQALDIPLTGCQTSEAGLDLIAEVLPDRGDCWIILDNFEQLVDVGTPVVARLHDAAPNARFIVTTREALGLPREQIVTLGALSPEHAAALFIDRARAARPDLNIDDDAQDTIRRIVAEIDGIPLAIELAAARVRVLALAQIHDRLGDALRLLAEKSTARPQRHQTLRATIDWSWQHLEPWEQDALAQCAVFRGGFTVDAAEAVVDLSAHADAPWTLDVLQALRDQSLLQVATRPRLPDQTRLGMYQTVRIYAEEHLEKANGLDAARERHRAWAVGEAEQLQGQWHSSDPRTPRLRMGIERDNLFSALHGSRNDDPESQARLALCLVHLVWITGPMQNLMDLLDGIGSGISEHLLPLVYYERGMALQQAGRGADARAAVQIGLDKARAIGDRETEHILLHGTATLDHDEGRLEDAVARAHEAIEIAQDIGPQHLTGRYHYTLASLYRHMGRPGDAETEYAAAMAIHRDVGDTRFQAATMAGMGSLARIQGAHSEALERYEEALQQLQDIGDPAGEAVVLDMLGNLSAVLGRSEAARMYYERALQIARNRRAKLREALILTNYATLSLDTGELVTADEMLRQAIAAHESHGRQLYASVAKSHLGTVLLARGRVITAIEVLTEARDTLEEINSRRFLAHANAWLSVAFALDGRPAQDHLSSARAAFKAASEPEGLSLCDVIGGFVDPAKAAACIERASTPGPANGDHPKGRPPPRSVSIDVRVAIRLLERQMEAE